MRARFSCSALSLPEANSGSRSTSSRSVVWEHLGRRAPLRLGPRPRAEGCGIGAGMITDSGREERTTKRVALYARVSTVNHGQDSEVQLRELREFCLRRRFEIAVEYVDKGISGSRERRPSLDKLMTACRKRLVDAVTRAGCNVGGVATANTILENIAVDIPTVFGAGSPEANEVSTNPGQAFADFVGIGIHCAAGDALCSAAKNGKQDSLPDEPGGYSGFNGLFGHKYVAPQISPDGPLTDLNGDVIQDPSGHIGFPGFDGMAAKVSLSYVAAMQEHGVPVTYAYISDAHDKHPSGPAFGPGQAGYVAALQAYDDAFNEFFTRLADDGINANNTLFIFTADEGDHFVGGAPSPANCDGVTVPCTYSQIGEINANLAGLLATEQGITTPFKVHSDDAPTIYITGNPARTDPEARSFARALDGLTAANPITGNTDKISQFLADPVEMKILHMITADPARTPNLVMFADPDYFLFAGAPNCNSPCVTEQPGFAWNHGDVQPDITTTWLGLVGPGIRDDGIDSQTWSDHTDIRPTIMLLTGLEDDYSHDGRVLSEAMTGAALPATIRGNANIFRRLAASYKQINAAVGQFGLGTLAISNTALISNDPGDTTYDQLESKLANLNSQRDSIASQMIQILEDAEFPP